MITEDAVTVALKLAFPHTEPVFESQFFPVAEGAIIIENEAELRSSLCLLDGPSLQRVLGDVLLCLLSDNDKTGIEEVISTLSVSVLPDYGPDTVSYDEVARLYGPAFVEEAFSTAGVHKTEDIPRYAVKRFFFSSFSQEQANAIVLWLRYVKEQNYKEIAAESLLWAEKFWSYMASEPLLPQSNKRVKRLKWSRNHKSR